MIDRKEIRRRAGRLGLDQRHVRNDYVLNHVLAAIAEQSSGLIFRGGTALARVYWPDYRLSEDLDFISVQRVEVGSFLKTATKLASQRTGLDLNVKLGKPSDGWMRSLVFWNDGTLLVDVNMDETAYLPATTRSLNLPYRDLGGAEREIEVVELAEILGNKWHMLGEDDRREPRDLFDVWVALQRRVPFEEIARGHKAKYGFLPTVDSLRQTLALSRLWEERLGHQVADLPAFAEVQAAVSSAFQEWDSRR
jgi:predicted nucleotidyltransferase component of viral defense system